MISSMFFCVSLLMYQSPCKVHVTQNRKIGRLLLSRLIFHIFSDLIFLFPKRTKKSQANLSWRELASFVENILLRRQIVKVKQYQSLRSSNFTTFLWIINPSLEFSLFMRRNRSEMNRKDNTNNKETWDDIYQIIIALGDLSGIGSLRVNSLSIFCSVLSKTLNIKLMPKSVFFIICEYLISSYFFWIYRSTENHKNETEFSRVSCLQSMILLDGGSKFHFIRLLLNLISSLSFLLLFDCWPFLRRLFFLKKRKIN